MAETKHELYNAVTEAVGNWISKSELLGETVQARRDLVDADNIIVRWDVGTGGGRRSCSFPIDKDALNKLRRDEIDKAIMTADQASIQAFNEMVEACVQFRIKYGDLDV